MKTTRLKLHTYFNDSQAKEVVYFTLEKYEPNLFGFNRKWRQLREYGPYGVSITISGDIVWANRIAKHYGIELPKSSKGVE